MRKLATEELTTRWALPARALKRDIIAIMGTSQSAVGAKAGQGTDPWLADLCWATAASLLLADWHQGCFGWLLIRRACASTGTFPAVPSVPAVSDMHVPR